MYSTGCVCEICTECTQSFEVVLGVRIHAEEDVSEKGLILKERNTLRCCVTKLVVVVLESLLDHLGIVNADVLWVHLGKVVGLLGVSMAQL